MTTPNKLELDVLGMSCAARVRRVENALRDVSGVHEATVNLATRTATVHYLPDMTSPSVIAQGVVDAGYEVANLAALDVAAQRGGRVDPNVRARVLEDAERTEERSIQNDLAYATLLTLPAVSIAMLSHGVISAFEQPWARWLQFGLITPVVFGPGRRFMRHAWTALKHHTSDMERASDRRRARSVGVLDRSLDRTSRVPAR